MDGDDRRRNQYGQQSYPISSSATTSPAQQMSYQPGDRFAQPLQPTSRAESSRPSITRPPTVPSYGAYGYPEQPPYAGQAMQGGNLQYQTAFSPEATRLQQPQPISPQYPPYQGQVLYGLGQQAPSQLPYDPIPQFQQRHSAAADVLSNQFGVQQYYAPGEPASSIPATQTPFVSSQNEPMRFPPQTPVRRPSIQQSYDVEMDYSPMGSTNPQEQQQQIIPSSDNMDEAFNRYQQQLKMTFDAIGAGRLAEAGVELMIVSRWLLSNVAKLGELDRPLRAGMKLIS